MPTLTTTYWYVKAEYLPALQMAATSTEPTRMVDQTVWQITGEKDGYFWGNCAVLMYEAGTTPVDPPNSFRMVGSLTPDGNVQITFMPINRIGAALGIQGWGRIVTENGEDAFEMQMSSGSTSLSAHWALMFETKEDDASWTKLPGTNYSVPEFLQAAGF